AAFRLSADVASAQPVQYGQPRRATVGGEALAPQDWFFLGKTGDLIQLGVKPGLAAIRTTVKLTGPQDLFLYQSTLGIGVSQTFTLPADGVYEIEVRASNGEPPLNYDLSVSRLGADKVPFARLAAAEDRGAFSVNAPTASKLKAGTADAWWLDASANQMITLAALATSND